MQKYLSFFYGICLCLVWNQTVMAQHMQVTVASRPLPKAIQGLEVNANGKILFTKQGMTYVLNAAMDTVFKDIGVKAKFIGTSDEFATLITVGNRSLISIYNASNVKKDSILADIAILDYTFQPDGKKIYLITKSSQLVIIDLKTRQLTGGNTAVPPMNITGIGYLEPNKLLVGANIQGAIIDTTGATVSIYQTPNISVVRTQPTGNEYAVLHLGSDFSFLSWFQAGKEVKCKHQYASEYPYYEIVMGQVDTVHTKSSMVQSFDMRLDQMYLITTDQSGRLLLWDAHGHVKKQIELGSVNTIARFYTANKIIYYHNKQNKLVTVEY